MTTTAPPLQDHDPSNTCSLWMNENAPSNNMKQETSSFSVASDNSTCHHSSACSREGGSLMLNLDVNDFITCYLLLKSCPSSSSSTMNVADYIQNVQNSFTTTTTTTSLRNNTIVLDNVMMMMRTTTCDDEESMFCVHQLQPQNETINLHSSPLGVVTATMNMDHVTTATTNATVTLTTPPHTTMNSSCSPTTTTPQSNSQFCAIQSPPLFIDESKTDHSKRTSSSVTMMMKKKKKQSILEASKKITKRSSSSSSSSRGRVLVHQNNNNNNRTSKTTFINTNYSSKQAPKGHKSSMNPPKPESMQFTFPSWTFHLLNTTSSTARPDESKASPSSKSKTNSLISSSSSKGASNNSSNGVKFKMQTISPFHSL
ncbi:hypothetical protein FDP41_006211 [Naegleria fowleri]|uniref:Uncharacterized protein n=1 Tax=Naegleria fowleri TaxID=5763 RepID=A0A6A5BCC2_NAEFO|nr:uncharacterized protein FDP41_006211 [Naegleria fowleri]KAF0974737.1 hypothetical protein FDP41_006211 [Naegleria fowleri]